MSSSTAKLNVFITSPLEVEYVDRIRAVAPAQVEVVYAADLLPPTRYIADHKGVEDFRRNPGQQKRWEQHLAEAEVLWDFPADVPGQALGLGGAPKVRWVQTTSSGVGQLVKDLGLQGSDVLVTTARGVHAAPLTEFVALALLIHYRDLAHLSSEKEHQHWARYCGDGLEGKTLAVIGAGQVGRRVLAMGRNFGMRTVYLGSPGGTSHAEVIGAEFYNSDALYDMLAISDAVVLSTPHTTETEKMIDAKAFRAMKPGGVFVNVARGAVVDEPALIEALVTGQVGFAALDVFAVEPLPPESRLWNLPNVLISPHSASTVERENALITDIFCRNLERYLAGRFNEMENILDKARLY